MENIEREQERKLQVEIMEESVKIPAKPAMITVVEFSLTDLVKGFIKIFRRK